MELLSRAPEDDFRLGARSVGAWFQSRMGIVRRLQRIMVLVLWREQHAAIQLPGLTQTRFGEDIQRKSCERQYNSSHLLKRDD